MRKYKRWKELFEIKINREDDVNESSFKLSIGFGHVLIILAIIILTIYTCHKVA
jgi:hypothetical protein